MDRDIRELECLVKAYYLTLLEERVGRRLDYDKEVEPIVRQWFLSRPLSAWHEARQSKAAFSAVMSGLFQTMVDELSAKEPTHDGDVLGDVQPGSDSDPHSGWVVD